MSDADDSITNPSIETVTPEGLRVRAKMLQGCGGPNDSGSTSRHLELAADKIEGLWSALSLLLVEYVAGRKIGNIDSLPADEKRVVDMARSVLGNGKVLRAATVPSEEEIAKKIEHELHSFDIGCGDEVNIADALASFAREKTVANANEKIGTLSAFCAGAVLALLKRTPESPVNQPVWQPIETAPHGKDLLITNPGHGRVVQIGRFIDPKHRDYDEPADREWWRIGRAAEGHPIGMRPKLWQPVPVSPASQTSGQ